MKRKIRENGSDGRQEMYAEGEMTSAKRRRKGWKPRDESEGDSALSSGQCTAKGGWICVSYVERQEVPRVFVSRRYSRMEPEGNGYKGVCK